MKQKTKILGVRYTGRDQMKTYDKIEALAKRKDAFTSDIARALIKSGMVHNDNPEPEGKKESRLDRANRLKKKFISEVNSDMVNDNDNPGPGLEDKKKVTKVITS
ncbi:unnamed protein product [marine sediment metagenome]|uniref:Uncharacterized protein n=1 Tax=marine sediment metagenome TaxID=412755 RepID=X1MD49_9ZZZZ